MLQFCLVSNSISHTTLSIKMRGIFFKRTVSLVFIVSLCYAYVNVYVLCVCIVGHGYTTHIYMCVCVCVEINNEHESDSMEKKDVSKN